MRILQVSSSVAARLGGPTTTIANMAAGLSSLGHVVDLVTLDDDASREGQFRTGEIWTLGGRSLSMGTATYYQYSRHLRPWLKRNADRYDVVILHGLWQFATTCAGRVLARRRIPYVIWLHGMLDQRANRFTKRLKKALYWRIADAVVVRHASGIVFTTQDELRNADPWLRVDNEKCYVIGNGISSPPEREEIDVGEDELDNDPRRRKLVYLGRIHESKGCDLLLKALAAVRNQADSFRLVIAGPTDNNEEAARLRTATQSLGLCDVVSWVGAVAGRDKWKLLYSADALILPSHRESFGLAVVEAIACGVPVLITDKVAIAADVLECSAGYVEEDTLRGIICLLERWRSVTKAERLRFSVNARECFERKFRLDQVVLRLEHFLARVVQRKGGQ